MQPVFEGHHQLIGISAGLRPVVRSPQVLPDPVVWGGSDIDVSGTSIYGSVLRDGGLFRMWYQAWPRRWAGGDAVTVGCLESDDGLEWRRPAYGLVECCGSRQNALTDLPFHSPVVLVDPHAGGQARFRAFGFSGPHRLGDQFHHALASDGFYTAHSADGIHWELDGLEPVWPHADVITAVWDPWLDCVRVVLKHNRRVAGMQRRCFDESTWDGSAGGAPPVAAFIPDELDDLNARARGFVSADYYGVGLMPTAGPTVAFLWNFRHLAPLQHDERTLGHWADKGSVDLSLMVQPERGGRWLHVAGRPDWLAAAAAPEWARGGLYTAAFPIDVADETWLYFTGTREQHGWCGVGVDTEQYRAGTIPDGGFARIGLLKWPRHRLIGLRALHPERVQIHPRRTGVVADGALRLNATAAPGGRVRARLLDDRREPLPGFDFEDCDPIPADVLEHRVRWRSRAVLPSSAEQAPIIAEVELADATLFAFDFAVP